tara:strand:- start:14677 stop:16071 length:1395 start_codon:yes stop_codon:yes gene_type:complete
MANNNVINCKKLSIDLIEYLFSIKGDGIFKEWIDLDRKKTFGNVMVDDIGDTSPFAYYVYDNYNTNNKDQIDLYTKNVISKYQQKNGLFITNQNLDKKNSRYLKIYNSDKMSDISLGLNLMFKLTKDQFYLDSSIKFFNGLEKLNIINHSIAYMKWGIIKTPFFSGKWDGLYIEEKVNLYNLTNDYKYIDSALQHSNYWINSKFFNTHGLFSFESNLFVKPLIRPVFKLALGIPFDSAMSSKANANLIFGLTELYLVTKNPKLKEALIKWVESTEKLFMHPEGYFYSFWSKKDGQKYVFLGNDHAMVDALIGIYQATGFENAFTIAIKNVDYWLSQQTEEGYFNQGVEGEKVTFAKWVKGNHPKMTRLDTLTDYGVMLLKVYELTGDKKYFIACKKMISALLKYSSYGKAYVDVINTRTLKKKDFMVETKFLFLLTKLFLSFDLINNNGSIYNNSVFKSLIRDR